LRFAAADFGGSLVSFRIVSSPNNVNCAFHK